MTYVDRGVGYCNIIKTFILIYELPGISNPQTIRTIGFSFNVGIKHVLDLIIWLNDLNLTILWFVRVKSVHYNLAWLQMTNQSIAIDPRSMVNYTRKRILQIATLHRTSKLG